MKSLLIIPPELPVKVVIDPPLSKSISNRMLVIGHLAGDAGSVRIPEANDCYLMRSLINKISNGENKIFDAEDAGTVFRFLTALLSVTPGERILTGTPRMLKRPVRPLVEALLELGADIMYLNEHGFPPLKITGKKLTGGTVGIDGSLSSQFISAIMMIAPVMKDGVNLRIMGNTTSLPYIVMTQELMNSCNIKVENTGSEIYVYPGKYEVNNMVYEADWSGASYWYALVSLQEGSSVVLTGLKKDSLQGDSQLPEIYDKLGVSSQWDSDQLILNHCKIKQSVVNLNLKNNPDLAPAIAVTCAGNGINARLEGLSTLSLKESNRLISISKNLNSLGFTCEVENNSSIHISGISHPSANNLIETYNDHRIAMSMSLLSIVKGPLIVDDMKVVQKSYPEFWDHLNKAGFKITHPLS